MATIEKHKATGSNIPHLPRGASAVEIDAAIGEVGAVVVEDFVGRDQLDRVSRDLEPWVGNTEPGSRSGDPEWEAFHGRNTRRLNGIAAKSDAFVEMAINPTVLGAAERRLEPETKAIQISDTQLISIGPGEEAQYLHRDQSAWPWFNSLLPSGPEVTVVGLVAATDCTAENGATRVVPFSHGQPDSESLFDPDSAVPAEMTAGSVLLFSGKTVHGGGANCTENEWRSVLHIGYLLGWLRTEEAHPFAIPPDVAARLPRRAKELFGFAEYNPAPKPGGRLWLVDFEDPAALFTAA